MKSNKQNLLALFIIGLCALPSCKKEEPKPQPIHVSSVSISSENLTLTEGESQTLTATVSPSNADNQKVIWSSSDASIASVDGGKVSAIKAGTAAITAKSDDGGKTATCTITVLPLIPEGALSSIFSVGETKKVHFSKGNLQATYDGSTYTWSFAANQYDHVGYAPGNTTIDSQTTGNVVDSFGWSTAATNYGINTSMSAADYSGAFKDWGEVFGSATWRTLSMDEWEYLLNKRAIGGYKGVRYSYRCSTITLSDGTTIYGLMLAPDNFEGEELPSDVDWESWQALESQGCVFLPSNYIRNFETFDGSEGAFYWCSSAKDGLSSYGLLVLGDILGTSITNLYRYYGLSVRLVCDVK